MSSSLDVVNRFIAEFQSGGNESVALELLADDFVDYTRFGATREDVIALFRLPRSACPDLRAEVDGQIARGDRVAARKTFFGTHEGQFAGIDATHRKVAIPVIDILRIHDGKLREHWNVVDVADLMDQLTHRNSVVG